MPDIASWCAKRSFVPTGKEYTDGKYNIRGDIPQNILDYLQVTVPLCQ